MADSAIELGSRIFSEGFRLSLPIFAVILTINIAMALITKFAQEFQVMMLSFPLRLAVGLFVDATISGRQVSDAVSIPSSALRAGDVVFLVNDQGRLEIRNVNVAHVGAGTAVVVGGVEAGEQVITSAIRNPIQGMALSRIDGGSVASDN
jgi:hypothetical protein